MLVPNPPGSICQRAPVVPHTRGKDEMRGGHPTATSLFGRDPFYASTLARIACDGPLPLNSRSRSASALTQPPPRSRITTYSTLTTLDTRDSDHAQNWELCMIDRWIR